MKVIINTTTVRETCGDGSIYIGSKTYHRVYDQSGKFIRHSTENLRTVKNELKECGYTEFEMNRQIKTFNRSRIV